MQTQIRRAIDLTKVLGHHAEDDVAGAVMPVLRHGRRDRGRFKVSSEAEVVEHSCRIGRKRNSRALIDQLRRALVHSNGEARLSHSQGGRQAADATTHNRDLHVFSPWYVDTSW